MLIRHSAVETSQGIDSLCTEGLLNVGEIVG